MDQHLRNTQSDKAYEIHDQMPLNFMISHFKRFKVLQTHVENWEMKRNGPIYPVSFCFIFSVSVEEPLGPMFTINLDKRHIMNMQIYDESFNISLGKYLPISYCRHFFKAPRY